MSRCVVLCALALSSCTLLFDPGDSQPGSREEDQEFMVAIDGDPDTPGYELYVGRTVDEVSFIEHYDSSATPTLLEGRFELPLRLTAMIRSRDSFPSVLIMGTGDSDGDGTRDTEYLDRVGWDNVAGGIAGGSLSSSYPHEIGPALPGSDSMVSVSFYVPDQWQFYSTGKDIRLVSSNSGWDIVDIDPEPLLRFDEPVTCIHGHDLGLSSSELTLMAGSTVALIDANSQGDGQTLHDVAQRVTEMPFQMKECTYYRGRSAPSYLTTDGSSVHAIGLDPEASFLVSTPLTGEPAHDRVIDLSLLNLSNNGDPDLVLLVADPPTLYLGLDTRVDSDTIRFSSPMIAQPLDFEPTAAVSLSNGADDTDRLYISEAKGPPHCFQLDTVGLAPALIPCTP